MNKNGQSGLEEVVHKADNTLQFVAAEDITEYRFRGSNDVVTNNYVYFNCTDIHNQTSTTCDFYRMIGIFPVDNGFGKIENRIKLIKAESYENYLWNEKRENNWVKASLNKLLNSTYYNKLEPGYQNLIGNSKHYLGGYNTDSVFFTSDLYLFERKIQVITIILMNLQLI